ncbi:MAG: GYD domain-containing protein [Microbacteriaceae bacterium]
MTTYLQFARYSPAGMQSVLDSGMAARRETVAQALAEVGGKLLRFDLTVSGRFHFAQLIETPDAATLFAANGLALRSGGFDPEVEIVELLDLDAFDARRAAVLGSGYVPPTRS